MIRAVLQPAQHHVDTTYYSYNSVYTAQQNDRVYIVAVRIKNQDIDLSVCAFGWYF
jgi:hypothetical protein